MPARVQPCFREPTDMECGEKSLRIFHSLYVNATQSMRHLTQQTRFAKSSVHQLKHAKEILADARGGPKRIIVPQRPRRWRRYGGTCMQIPTSFGSRLR